MSLENLDKKLFKNKKFKKYYYDKSDLEFEISNMVTDLRILKGISQKELSKKIKTKQSSIARLERGNSLPSLSFLQKIAKACNTKLLPPRFVILEKTKNYSNSNMNTTNYQDKKIQDNPFDIKVSHTQYNASATSATSEILYSLMKTDKKAIKPPISK